MAERCILCNSENLEVLKTTKQEVYVTGDRKKFDIENRKIKKVICRECGTVQFLNNADHCNATDQVFRDYDIIDMKTWSVDGKEVKHSPQLQTEYERIAAAVSLPKTGRMLDIGCGGGEALSQFHSIYPEWETYGMDIGEQFRAAVLKREGVKDFFSSWKELEKSQLKFDFISINHTLCLLSNLVQVLEIVHGLLADRGIFFVMDTDYEVHPWILYDIEYSWFFTRDYMRSVISGFGFEILDVNFKHEEKEIALFCSKDETLPRQFPSSYQMNKEIYERKIEYLNRVIDTVRICVEGNRDVGIFGTSIAGVWVSEIITKGDIDRMGKNIFYIEEDEEILQRKTGVNGYPICRLEDIEEDAVILLPFPKYIAKSIKSRCESRYCNCEFIVFE